jgi:hypothetical protein
VTQTYLSNSTIWAINNLGTGPSPVIGINPGRKTITFHAPGANDIYVAPAFVLTNMAVSVALVPSLSVLGGCFHIFAGASLTISGPSAAQAWQAFAATGSNQPLTIQEGFQGWS